MELLINGNAINTVIIKCKNEYRYKVLEEASEASSSYGVLITHINSEDKEVLDFFDYKEKEECNSIVDKAIEDANKNGYEVISDKRDSTEVVLKHYIFSDESKAITYEDDYATIEEAEAFNNLLIKQFGKKFSYHEVE